MPEISVVVPVYKEEQNIRPFLERTEACLEKLNVEYEIIFSVDPSPDRTEEMIEREIARNPKIRMMVFSRRFGQPTATMAAIMSCNGSVCAVIDVDLQDPPELIVPMYEKLREGYEVVYARRRSRKGETIIKRVVSSVGYYLISHLSDVTIPRDTGDFRLISRRVIEELRCLNETHGFLRGLVAFVGFKQTFVEYDRDARHLGRGNYNPLVGSMQIGLNGLISFSSRPLFLMSLSGMILAGVSFLVGLWYVLQKLLGFGIVEGLPTIVLAITFFSGVQLLGLGLLGEYVGRIYDEVKRRPAFILDRRVNFPET